MKVHNPLVPLKYFINFWIVSPCSSLGVQEFMDDYHLKIASKELPVSLTSLARMTYFYLLLMLTWSNFAYGKVIPILFWICKYNLKVYVVKT
jgi:hypothetical protein